MSGKAEVREVFRKLGRNYDEGDITYKRYKGVPDAAVKAIYLRGNDRLPSGIFDQLNSLEILILTGTGLPAMFSRGNEIKLTSLPKGIFDKLTSLTKLHLNFNKLTSLPKGIFYKLTSLEVLDLSSNKLISLPKGIFDKLTSLEVLELSGNKLTSLPKGIFDKLTSLEVLELDNNQLTSLPESIFDKLSSLEVLTLSRNQLTELPEGIIKLDKLKSLKLSYNPLPSYLIYEDIYVQDLHGEDLQSALHQYDREVWEPARKQRKEEEKRTEKKRKERQKKEEDFRRKTEINRILKFHELAKLPYPGSIGEVPHIELAEEWEVSVEETENIMKQFIREGKIKIAKKLGHETRDDYSDDVWIVDDEKSSPLPNENVPIKDLGEKVLKIVNQVRVDIPMSLIRLSELALSNKNYVEIILMSMIDQQPDLGEYLPLEQVFIKKSEVKNEIFTKSTFTDSLQTCKNCGDSQSILIRTCTNCGEALPHCNICKRGFAERDQITNCPECDNPFHRTHLIAQVQSSGSCPVCRKSLNLTQVS